MSPEELISLSRLVKFSDNLQREIKPEEAIKLLDFVELLSKWSERMNLVSSSNPNRIVNEHILDCWAAFAFVPRETIYLDIGSGSGLPGVIFSSMAPNDKIILLEPRAKRVEFLKEVRRNLKLENIDITQSRLEDWKGETGKVSAVERAVGMEKEIYSLLRTKLTEFSLSAMVSMTWENPITEEPNKTDFYSLPNGSTHKVVCFT